MAEKKLVYFQMYTSFKMIKVECSSWFVLVYSVCWKQTESTWDTNQLLPFAVMHLEFFSEKITTILTILLHFWIKTYDKITDTAQTKTLLSRVYHDFEYFLKNGVKEWKILYSRFYWTILKNYVETFRYICTKKF